MKDNKTQSVDQLYEQLQQKHGESSALVNGYRSHRYFVNEQQLVLSLVSEKATRILDLACGSGLMTQPLNKDDTEVIGLDFNESACAAASKLLTSCIQGDAFDLPFEDNSFDSIVNCQFLNQQTPEDVARMFAECQRVLKPNGQMIVVWRNGSALIHKVAHSLLTLKDKLTNNPNFPVFEHPIPQVSESAIQQGLTVEQSFSFFASLNWEIRQIDSVLSKLFGASGVLVLRK